jgi:hypothetical protein
VRLSATVRALAGLVPPAFYKLTVRMPDPVRFVSNWPETP